MPFLQEALEQIRESSDSKAALGRKFERLMQNVFRTHPGEFGPARFQEAWLWEEWRRHLKEQGEQDPGTDSGIDIVLQLTEPYGGGLVAVQCKNLATQKAGTTGVNKFLKEALLSEQYQELIFVSTTSLTRKAVSDLNKAKATIITGADIDQWPIGDIRNLINKPEEVEFDVEKYTPRDHQEQVLLNIKKKLFEEPETDRATVIMPCGTGKSVTALWAAERNLPHGGRVLYLVPSIALMSQTLREWATHRDHSLPQVYLSVCSDTQAGRKSGNEDSNISELAIPPTTDAQKIANWLNHDVNKTLQVTFSTYQSLPKIKEAQQAGTPGFDFVICDEAHRTASVKSTQDEDPAFTMIHSNDNIQAAKRLYMTATPRISGEGRSKSDTGDDYSMDDEVTYGEEIYRMSFREAIAQKLLCDYRVLVVAVDEEPAADASNKQRADLDIKASQQLLGVWDALSDPYTEGLFREGRPAGVVNPDEVFHIKRAIGFCNTIAKSKQAAAHWETLLQDAQMQNQARYRDWAAEQRKDDKVGEVLGIKAKHIDGTMGAHERSETIRWLKEGDSDDYITRIIVNAKCLTEGVDVPALDGIIFMAPKRSRIDIVQAVGRVMRNPDPKKNKTGFVIVPILVPKGKTADDPAVLTKGSVWKPVWDILMALRDHDESMDGYLTDAKLVTRKAPVALIDNTSEAKKLREADGFPVQGSFWGNLPMTVASMMVDKVSDKRFWSRWGEKVGQLVGNIQRRVYAAATDPATSKEITGLLENYKEGMKQALRLETLSDEDMIELLAQHLVTSPVLDALFHGQEFVKTNPISKELQKACDMLVPQNEAEASEDRLGLMKELKTMENYNARMKRQLHEIDDSDVRLNVLLDLYENFFKHAMPKETNRLGIVYTPVELVDFMWRSVDAVLKENLGIKEGISAEEVYVLDPFTGTGTFINRLLTIREQVNNPYSDYLIKDDDLDRKYFGPSQGKPPELHASELLLLAYYIASLKIEEGYRQRKQLEPAAHAEYEGIALTDSFLDATDHHGQGALQLEGIKENNERVAARADLPILIYAGNPPWSDGQDTATEDNPNKEYQELADRIRETYIAKHKEIPDTSTSVKAAGNLYVKAIRMATDGLDPKKGGVVAFVHPNSLTEGTSLAGMRASLREEFSDLYIVNLRGNAYKQGTAVIEEGEKIFGSGSRNGVQITIAVQQPDKPTNQQGTVHYAKVPPALKLPAKLEWLESLGTVLSDQFRIVPENDRHDWDELREASYQNLIPLCSLNKASEDKLQPLATEHALGVITGCDAYVYDYNREALIDKVASLVDAFNTALWEAWHTIKDIGLSVDEAIVDATINDDIHIIKWNDRLKKSLTKILKQSVNKNSEPVEIEIEIERCREVLYRPFIKMWLYEDDRILSSVGTISKMFKNYDSRLDSTETPPRSLSPPRPRGRQTSQYSVRDTSQTVLQLEQSTSQGVSHQRNSSRNIYSNRTGNTSFASTNRSLGDGETPTSDNVLLSPPPDHLHSPNRDNNFRTLHHQNPTRPRSRSGTAIHQDRPVAAILVEMSLQIEFGILASPLLADLHTTGRTPRIIMSP